jgi:hypothetical protein
MSASRSLSGSSRSARSSKKKASPAVVAARAPWIRNGIDYGPARAAILDLATWALDIAERAVADWPAGRAHVRNTRRLVEARIAGKRPRGASIDDVMFTARLLARFFDDDLGLDLSDALTIFDILDLPIEVVPVSSYAPRPTRTATSVLHTLTRNTAPIAPAARATVPPPLRFCDECGYVHEPREHVRHRNAA